MSGIVDATRLKRVAYSIAMPGMYDEKSCVSSGTSRSPKTVDLHARAT